MVAAIFAGETFRNSSFPCLARIEGFANQPLTKACISSISYQVWDTVTETKIKDTTVVDKDAALFDYLQIDNYWTVDQTGYNFKLVVPGDAIPTTNTHQVDVLIEPYDCEPFLIVFATTPTQSYFDDWPA